MLRRAATALLVILFALPAGAVDVSRAEGALVTDGVQITLSHAYIQKNSHNDLTNRNDTTKIILTDKPLPEGTRLRDVDYNFPLDVLGLVVVVDRQMQPMHLVVQHPKGVYDGGWLDNERDVTVRARQAGSTFDGKVSCRHAEKASVKFSFDVSFAAVAQ